jgi:hypothetical protein
MRTVRFERSTNDVLICFGSGRHVASANTLGRTVTLFALRRRALQLHKLGIVDIRTECALDGFQVGLVAVAGKLDPVGKS